MPLTGGDLGKFEEEIVKKYINDTDSPLSDYLIGTFRAYFFPGSRTTVTIPGKTIVSELNNTDETYSRLYYFPSGTTVSFSISTTGYSNVTGSVTLNPGQYSSMSSSYSINTSTISQYNEGGSDLEYSYPKPEGATKIRFNGVCGGGGGGISYSGGGGAGFIKNTTVDIDVSEDNLNVVLGKRVLGIYTSVSMTTGGSTILSGVYNATFTGGSPGSGSAGGAGGSPNGSKGGNYQTAGTASSSASGGTTDGTYGGGGASYGKGGNGRNTLVSSDAPGYGGGSGGSYSSSSDTEAKKGGMSYISFYWIKTLM